MIQDSKAFYRERYLAVIHDGDDPAEVVNQFSKRPYAVMIRKQWTLFAG